MSLRRIALSDGTGMGDEMIIFETNAPAEELKKLEKESCQVYIDGGDYKDVPIWADILTAKGYIFNLVDTHSHVNPFTTSTDWLETRFPEIKEYYVIDNQPERTQEADEIDR